MRVAGRPMAPVAASVDVAPERESDWNAVVRASADVERNLLRQIGVAREGQAFPFYPTSGFGTPDGAPIRLEAVRVSPSAPGGVARIGLETELRIAPWAPNTVKNGGDGAKETNGDGATEETPVEATRKTFEATKPFDGAATESSAAFAASGAATTLRAWTCRGVVAAWPRAVRPAADDSAVNSVDSAVDSSSAASAAAASVAAAPTTCVRVSGDDPRRHSGRVARRVRRGARPREASPGDGPAGRSGRTAGAPRLRGAEGGERHLALAGAPRPPRRHAGRAPRRASRPAKFFSREPRGPEPALVRLRPRLFRDASEPPPSRRRREDAARAGHKSRRGVRREVLFPSTDATPPRLGPSDPRTLGPSRGASRGARPSRAARPPRTRTARRARSSRGGSRPRRGSRPPRRPAGSRVAARWRSRREPSSTRASAAPPRRSRWRCAPRAASRSSPRRTFSPGRSDREGRPRRARRALCLSNGERFVRAERRDSWCAPRGGVPPAVGSRRPRHRRRGGGPAAILRRLRKGLRKRRPPPTLPALRRPGRVTPRRRLPGVSPPRRGFARAARRASAAAGSSSGLPRERRVGDGASRRPATPRRPRDARGGGDGGLRVDSFGRGRLEGGFDAADGGPSPGDRGRAAIREPRSARPPSSR